MPPNDPKLDRYLRQVRFAPLGQQGQRRLMAGRVLVVGCGALGCVVADTLVRAGVGFLRIVDRDFVETGNLHRQILFDEQDVAQGLPKAAAAGRRLAQINSQVEVEAIVADVNATNMRELGKQVDLILDGTDNLETRYLINDFSLESGTPWIFGGSVGSEGQTLTILPGETPCLACVMPEPPPAAVMPTCESAGVLASIVNVVASLQAVEAIKLLSGNREQLNRGMTVIDLWRNTWRNLGVASLGKQDTCRACSQRDFVWLEGKRGSSAVALCGRNSVQISATSTTPIALPKLAEKLKPLGSVTSNPFLVRLEVDGYVLTLFADGRTIVGGTDDPTVARTVLAKYVGG